MATAAPATATSDPVATQLYDTARAWCHQHEQPTPATVVQFTIHLVTAVQRMVKEPSRGPYKKTLVLTTLDRVLRNDVNWAHEADRDAVLLVVEWTVPPLIDVSVQIARGEIDIKGQAQRVLQRCCCLS